MTPFIRLLPIVLLLMGASPLLAEDDALENADDQARKEAEENQKREEASIKAQFTYTANDIADKLVFISSDTPDGKRSSTGFIAEQDGNTYLFTCISDILGSDTLSFKTATGTLLRPSKVELAPDRKIARLLLEPGTGGFTLADERSVDTPIAVFGNAEGSGVISDMYGKVVTVGSEELEISAAFVSGNSGSPVLNQATQIVGIVSHVRYTRKDGKDDSTLRRFCYRVDSSRWMAVDWRQYNRQFGARYLETSRTFNDINAITSQWIANPYARIYLGTKPPSGLAEFDEYQDGVLALLKTYSSITRVTLGQLDGMNEILGKRVAASALALSGYCRTEARKILRMQTLYRDPTGFLQNEIKDYGERLELTADVIALVGQSRAKYQYYRFKQEEKK